MTPWKAMKYVLMSKILGKKYLS